MRNDNRDREGDTRFLREAEQERDLHEDLHQDPERGANQDGMVRDRQAAQQRERLRDADKAVRDLPDHNTDASPDEPSGT